MEVESVADWSPVEIRVHYRMGHCHVMAVALSRATGLPLGVMWNGLDWHIEPDEDGLGGEREVVHVFVDCGDGRAIDVEGVRTTEEMRRDLAGHWWEACPCGPLTEQALDDLVHQTSNLAPYDEGCVAEAEEVIRGSSVLTEAVAAFGSQGLGMR